MNDYCQYPRLKETRGQSSQRGAPPSCLAAGTSVPSGLKKFCELPHFLTLRPREVPGKLLVIYPLPEKTPFSGIQGRCLLVLTRLMRLLQETLKKTKKGSLVFLKLPGFSAHSCNHQRPKSKPRGMEAFLGIPCAPCGVAR